MNIPVRESALHFSAKALLGYKKAIHAPYTYIYSKSSDLQQPVQHTVESDIGDTLQHIHKSINVNIKFINFYCNFCF